jgi:L-2,4-diaminobutyrate transaminase
MDLAPNSLRQKDLQSLFHPFTNLPQHSVTGPRVIVSAEDVRVTDEDGRTYLDGLAGLWCVNVGYGRKEMADAIHAQAKRLSFGHSFGSNAPDVTIELASRVAAVAPANVTKVLFGTSGTDANDTNIKLAWLYNELKGRPSKKKIITRWRSYHGTSLSVTAATGLNTVHAGFDFPEGHIRRVSPACFYWRRKREQTEAEYTQSLLDELEALILNEGPSTIAAFLAEPIGGAGGLLIPPAGYWQGVQRILKQYDILLILDEVITGFGRTGRMFAAETFDIQPDLMSIAKGLTSGYVPMSASLVSSKIWDQILESYQSIGVFGHGLTYSGHPLGAAAGLASLDIIEREGLVERARTSGAYLKKLLESKVRAHPVVGDVRSVGLIAGVEIDRDISARLLASSPAINPASFVTMACLEEGLMLRPLMDSNVIAISPPLVIQEGDLEVIVGTLCRCLDKLQAKLGI